MEQSFGLLLRVQRSQPVFTGTVCCVCRLKLAILLWQLQQANVTRIQYTTVQFEHSLLEM